MFRMKVLLAGIAVLFLAIFVIVAVLVATRARTVPRGAGTPAINHARKQTAAFASRRAPRVESDRPLGRNGLAESVTPRGGVSSARAP